jgi:hypothetical protein
MDGLAASTFQSHTRVKAEPSSLVFGRSAGRGCGPDACQLGELSSGLLQMAGCTLSPDKFYKGRSQEKTHLLRLEFLLLRSPLDGAGSVLTARAKCSVAGQLDPVVWVFSTSGFHRFLGDEAHQFRNQQSRTVVNVGDHSSIWDSWPIAFSGYPRGPRVVVRLGARGTQA